MQLSRKLWYSVSQRTIYSLKLNTRLFRERHKFDSPTHKNSAYKVEELRCSNRLSCQRPYSQKFSVDKNYLKIDLHNGKKSFPWPWLRDHCRSSVCYNSSTNQKNGIINLFGDANQWEPADVQQENDSLIIKWKDGHTSSFTLQWLGKNSINSRRDPNVTPFYWTAEKIKTEPLPVVKYSDHMNTDKGLKSTLTNLLKYGFTIINETPVSAKGTSEVAERISFILETLYGKLWTFTSDGARADTAYSTLGIGAHTDTTYFTLPVGVQFLHCLEHDGEGGRTLLVDGFNAAHELLDESKEDFDILTKTVVPHEYIDQKLNDHYYSIGTVLSLSPVTGQLENIRFNRYDMAPLTTVPHQDLVRFYKAYNRLESRITSPDNEFHLQLKPGMVLFFDNWRVLHGRTGFTGKRVITGGYIGKDDLASAQRKYDLL